MCLLQKNKSCPSMCVRLSATATNGHPECLRLLMSNNNQHINVDAQDISGQ